MTNKDTYIKTLNNPVNPVIASKTLTLFHLKKISSTTIVTKEYIRYT